jgi:glycosyltransferase involved in cell wall biosynthesis
MNDMSERVPVRLQAEGGARPRLAIVSSFDELCGIAGYTRALQRQLGASFDITVFDLDQYLLRSPHRSVQKLADAHVTAIAAQLSGFDAVNIQLEHGTLGLTVAQILRRFRRLCGKAGQLSVTFHTILAPEPFDWAHWCGLLARFRIVRAFELIRAHRRSGSLSRGIYAGLKRRQARQPTRVIVHTRRDMRLVRDVMKIREVFDHPLSFVMPEQRCLVRDTARRDQFPLLRNLPQEAKLIGVFGFVSEYKGFDTAIRALRLLPADHHLLIFGGIHPQTIRKRVAIDPYLQQLLDIGYIDRTLLDELAAREGNSAQVQLALDGNSAALLERHPKSLVGRIHFMGSLNDAEFIAAMVVCDAVVLSYQEVGQSASGPISQAVELGCRVIASRTNTFLQYARYHPRQFEFFDIGNHLELAERLAAQSPIDCAARVLAYDWSSNVATYELANAQRGVAPKPVSAAQSWASVR